MASFGIYLVSFEKTPPYGTVLVEEGTDSLIGDVLRAQGDLSNALGSLRAATAIEVQLTEADPANASWRHDLAASYEKIGDILKAQGDLAGAPQSVQAGRVIFERLAKSEPANTGLQRDLAAADLLLSSIERGGPRGPGRDREFPVSGHARRQAPTAPSSAPRRRCFGHL